ncbi:MAG: penicillin-binding transpeptidase domain-containing protein, partial [Patescibacteria group bacterium]
LIKLETLNLPTIQISNGFARVYEDGKVFAPILGYTGVVSESDLEEFPELGGGDFVGKTGLEVFYENNLRGKPGVSIKIRDAKGNIIEEKEEVKPEIGEELKLTVNAGLQKYFYNRLQSGLSDLGRTVGLGLAIDPRDGRVLAMVNIPSYDNNIFSSPARKDEVVELLTSTSRPLFNRVVGGLYAPGSTIKPLHAVAALEEGVVEPSRQVFSPGFLNIANPYNPDQPSKFLDWQFQGWVDMYNALAQSSNVYFYTVGGGAPARSVGETVYEGSKISGLGIKKLNEWWSRFGLGEVLGIDLYGEKEGVLPTPEAREEETGRAWLLGDTYNVSIGQGDLLVTPLQLLSYIGAVANGGIVYRPFLALDHNQPKVVKDLGEAKDSILEVQKGMELAVKSPKGTARTLQDLPFYVAGKTGSAQVMNKAQENAFFVGYAGMDKENPEIAVLVLVENSRQGSLNAVPIAKDVLHWYYLNKMGKKGE